MEKKSVCIEFTGMAGVGKSTIIKEMIDLLRKENIQFYDNYYTKKRSKRKFKNILILIKTIYIIFLLKPNSFKSSVNLFKRIGRYQMFLNEGKDKEEIQIYDEGIFKIAADTFINSYQKTPLDALNILFKYIRKPKILIVVEADPKIIFQRRVIRNLHYDKISYSDVVKRYYNKDFDKMIDAFSKEVRIIKLKNNDETDSIENSKIILEMFKKYIS